MSPRWLGFNITNASRPLISENIKFKDMKSDPFQNRLKRQELRGKAANIFNGASPLGMLHAIVCVALSGPRLIGCSHRTRLVLEFGREDRSRWAITSNYGETYKLFDHVCTVHAYRIHHHWEEEEKRWWRLQSSIGWQHWRHVRLVADAFALEEPYHRFGAICCYYGSTDELLKLGEEYLRLRSCKVVTR